MRRAMIAGTMLLAVPAVALAAPPANDAPAGAVAFEEYTAGNLPDGQPAPERQGLVDLTEATRDPMIGRCLGPKSFAKDVWFEVPAADTPQLVRIEASSPAGGTAEVPDLALYAGGQVNEANACDGAATSKLATSAAAVEARLPAGTTALVQVGRSAGQTEQKVVASLNTKPLAPAKAPRGDTSFKAPRLAVGVARKVVLTGATLTAEDPAQPACPAAGTVWRRTKVTRSGRHRIVVRGAAAGSVTAFVGTAPGATNARACVNRAKSGGALAMKLRLKRGSVLWTRIGADAVKGSAKVRVKRLK